MSTGCTVTAMALRSKISALLAAQRGVIFASRPAIVFRGTYKGANVLAPNSLMEHRDEREYWP